MRMVCLPRQKTHTTSTVLSHPTNISSLPPSPHQLNETEENDVSVSFSDQQSINAFSRYNNRVTDYEEDLKRKREEKEAVEEVMMELELVDEEEEVL